MQTSLESFIRLCHNLILIKNNESEERIEAAKTFPLKNTIVDHIGKALGEDLNFETNPVIKKWNEKLYSLRNKIVHSGLSYISGDASYEAFDALEEIVIYLNGLMVKNGYMEEGGKVEIPPLNKNTPDHVNSDDVIKSLKERGFI
jgi:hypothetical protein